MSDEPVQAQAKPLDTFLSFKGRIGRGQFVAGLGAMIASGFVMMFAAASFMDPRGGFGLFIPITIVLLILIAWIHCAIVVKRLRDAGLASWYWVVFGPGPFLLLLLAAEYLGSLWWLAVLGALALIVAPAFFQSNPETSQ